MEELLLKLLLGQLKAAGFFNDETLKIDEMKKKIEFKSFYDRWLDESINVLEKNNYLKCNGKGYSIIYSGKTDQEHIWKEWNEKKGAWLENRDLKAKVVLLEVALRALPEIITGKLSATDVIFKDSSFELVEGIYRNNKAADYFNEVLADTLVEYIRQRLEQEPSARIRMLEIGAGTGGTSSVIFQKLRPYKDNIEEYCYTDLSKAFLIYAQKNFGAENPFLTYKIFNAEKSAAAQNITEEYDVVIATNVLHAVANIRKVLRNIKDLLSGNGFVMINEICKNSLFTHLTFGLLEGWWLYEDSEIRIPGCPGLYPEMWEKVLCDEGFGAVFFPAAEAHNVGQQIVVAQNDGRSSRKTTELQPQKSSDALKQPDTKHKVRTNTKVQSSHISSGADNQELKDYITGVIIEKLSSSLNVDTEVIDIDEAFADYGVDSIIGIGLVQSINDALLIELSNVDIFDYSSVNRLSKHILSKYNHQIIEKVKLDEVGPAAAEEENECEVEDTEEIEASEDAVKKQQKDTPTDKEPIAIIGMSGRFGKANSASELWDYLTSGTDLVEAVTRWELSECYSGRFNEYCNHGSFIEDIDKFDPLFFNISGLEATYMDPQQRIFLEEAWKALEDAGYAGSSVSGLSCGVYVGCCEGDYRQLYGDNAPPQSLWGSFASVIASRISYFLNLQGPAMAVDTACSSSLVATHLACQALRAGEIEMALAGGVFVSATPNYYMAAESAGMLSHTGRCFSFDNRADGMVPGEAVGVVILKRLKDAIADRDHIYGVIRGSGLNQDGTTNGITAPSANSQERLECSVYDNFNINPEHIQLIEAHGTGTKLGDPIEYQALTHAFRKYTDKKEYCTLGTVKSNIGHTQTAAGVTGIIKVLLALQNKQIPPLLHFQSGNTNIRFEGSPFCINTVLKDWNAEQGVKRLAAVSAFGASGTNAHMVIEEAPLADEKSISKPAYLIALSAKSLEQLRILAQSVVRYSRQKPHMSCGNMSYTLLTGRRHMNHRIACVVRDLNELVGSLEGWLEGRNVQQVLYSTFNEKKNREQPQQIEYGNKCIKELHSISDEKMYIEYLSEIAGLYVKGCALSFEGLFPEDQYSRISLPTYPFDKKSFWITGEKRSSVNQIRHELLKNEVYTPEEEATADFSEQALPQNGVFMFTPSWKEKKADSEKTAVYSEQLIILCEPDSNLERGITNQGDNVQWVILKNNDMSIEKRFQRYMVQVLEKIQDIIKKHPKGDVLVQVILEAKGEQELFSAFSGFLKSVRLEIPKLICQLIEVDSWGSLETIIGLTLENGRMPLDRQIKYEAGKRYCVEWEQIDIPDEKTSIPWKDDGVYLITGGMGGLGYIFATEIANKTKNATLILTGRSSLGERQAKLKELEAYNVKVEYRQVDVSCEKAVIALTEDIKQNFGHINGIVHCAGINLDNYIVRKTSDELLQVLAPKTSGLVYLDTATKDEKLDFFILFSSIAGIFGNAGQVDYAAGNAFMDAYAVYRNKLVKAGQRAGLTMSINWPLWRDGGMHVDEGKEKWLQESIGMSTMKTSNGIRAMYMAMASQHSRIAVLEGDLQKMQQCIPELSSMPKTHVDNDVKSYCEVDSEILKEQIIHKLKVMLDDTVKIGVDNINTEDEMENYGIDSIMINQLNDKLGRIFNDLSKTLFFEYSTIGSLAEFLTAEYSEECIRWAGLRCSDNTNKNAQKHLHNIKPVQNSFLNGKSYISKHGSEVPAEKEFEPIAIVGISGRFPGAENIKEFWENLKEGKDCVGEIPQDRWPLKDFYCDDPSQAVASGKSYSKWGGFLEGYADFDPFFFNITPKEAMCMDPQERLFIEVCWSVLEDAGYTRKSLEHLYNGRVGVFSGITKSGYALYGPDLWRQGEQMYPNSSFGSVANRVSYLFNLHGPSMPVDTMCSSSLTAVHEACEHIYRGDCDMAIAGGVNLNLHPSMYIFLSSKQMLSADGRCKSFGKGGNGYVPGEGACALFLKRYSQAVEDNDHIYGLIRGTSVNHGGKTNGFTVPNPVAQGELIRAALDKAGVNARIISYIEAHGTGTELGDPIEITGLTQAFQKDTKDTGFSSIGSLKSNIGHLEAAAGIAGIIKVLLQMKYKMLVPSLHSSELNPNINFAKTPFVVQQEFSEWKRPVITENGENREYPRLAGVSSFGAGGANAHVVIQEYIPEREDSYIETSPQNPAIIILSAKNKENLKEQARLLQCAIREPETRECGIASIAYTLQVGREAMEERMGVIVSSFKELDERLEGYIREDNGISKIFRGQVRHVKGLLEVFEDEDMSKTIELWIEKRKYSKLLELWVKGFNFDWNKLYKDSRPRRVSLPTYHFEAERYWIPDTIKQQKTTFNTAIKQSQCDDIYYEQLFDKVVNSEISIDEAAENIKKLV